MTFEDTPALYFRNLEHWIVTTAAHARTYVLGPTLSSFLRSIEMEYFDISCKKNCQFVVVILISAQYKHDSRAKNFFSPRRAVGI